MPERGKAPPGLVVQFVLVFWIRLDLDVRLAKDHQLKPVLLQDVVYLVPYGLLYPSLLNYPCRSSLAYDADEIDSFAQFPDKFRHGCCVIYQIHVFVVSTSQSIPAVSAGVLSSRPMCGLTKL